MFFVSIKEFTQANETEEKFFINLFSVIYCC